MKKNVMSLKATVNNIAKKSLAIGERKHKKEVLENCNIKIISTRRVMNICIVRYFESRGD